MTTKNIQLQSLHELVELHIKFVGEKNSDENCSLWWRKSYRRIWHEIKDGIKKHGYDGSEDYTVMYWFPKWIVSTSKE